MNHCTTVTLCGLGRRHPSSGYTDQEQVATELLRDMAQQFSF